MISVCIATYNGASYLSLQLSSILDQLGVDDEVIISDDGSTDETLKIVESMNDGRIRIVEGPRQASPVRNFENALLHSRGDIIFLSDQDDVWLDGKVKQMCKALEVSDCVTSNCVVTDDELSVTHPSFFALNRTKYGKAYNLLVKNGYLGCCMAFKRKILDKALPFPANIPMHDIWLGNVAAFYYSASFIEKPLIKFRRHDHNASVTALDSPYSIVRKLSFRLVIVVELFKCML